MLHERQPQHGPGRRPHGKCERRKTSLSVLLTLRVRSQALTLNVRSQTLTRSVRNTFPAETPAGGGHTARVPDEKRHFWREPLAAPLRFSSITVHNGPQRDLNGPQRDLNGPQRDLNG